MAESGSRMTLERCPLAFRTVTVRRVEDISPSYRRIVFGGDELAGFKTLAPADHVKVFFPNPGESHVVMPGGNGSDGAARSVSRDYTPLTFDPATNDLTIDFALHGTGPATTWARNAQQGNVAGIGGPRGSWIVQYDAFDWFLLIGDETSIPTISRARNDVPRGKDVIAVIEVESAAGKVELPANPDAEIHWVHRTEEPANGKPESLLVDYVKTLSFPPGEPFVQATGETSSLKWLRRHLLGERGLNRADVSVSGHWKRGTSDFDHHEPLEE